MNSRVLSIQSHVVFGYVGNKSATFPLQLLGFEVDAVNSVQLSNHTKYDSFKGQVLNEKDLEELMSGLSDNNLDNSYTHMLTGYVRNDTFLLEVVKTVRRLKEKNPGLLYVCDPVLGDGGKAYVPAELIPIYRDNLIPLADILTPNQTELQFLTGENGKTLDSVLKGIGILHSKGIKIVVVTSAEFENNVNQLQVFVSDDLKKQQAVIDVPKLTEKEFTGTGDLFSALFMAWYTKLNQDAFGALEHTVSTVQQILQRTLIEAKKDCYSVRSLELQLISSKSDIENPKILFKHRKL